MLIHLHVKNLALIESADIEFGEGLNILTGETGPDHNKQFEVEVRINGVPAGNGAGHTKKAAEQAAAYQAIRKIKK